MAVTRTQRIRPSVCRLLVPALVAGVLIAGAGSVHALTTTWTSDADFAAGTAVDIDIAANSLSLALDGVGAPDSSIGWWDPAWGQRRCLDITNNEAVALTEFQVAISIDTATPIAGGRMSPTGDDIRFIAADGVTELDHWIEGPIDDAATSIWVQTDTLPPGLSTVCTYYDNAGAAPQSDIYAPFTYTTPQPLYVAVAEAQANRALAVTSYVAGNIVSNGISTVTIGVGATHTFPAAENTDETVITATGPLALQGVGSGSDSYVPIAFAGTDFVVASSRNVNRLSIHAPFAAATATIEHSGTTTVVPIPAGTSVATDTDITATTDSIVVSSTEPVLVTHIAQGADALVAIPAGDDPIYGIRSTQHIIGFGAADTAVSIDESDGTHLFAGGVAGSAIARSSGGSQGTGPAVLVTPALGGSISSTQQADSDGGESTSYWPLSEMNVVYRTPVAAQYVAMACPEQTTGSLDSAGTTLDCTGTGGAPFPGKARDTGLAAGGLVQSLDGVPFFMYMEDNSQDENNVLGPKQARLTTTNPPTVAVGPEQSRHVSPGIWTSEARDTGCGSFFGDISWNPAAQPAGATATFQVATAAAAGGPFTFVGPDGTAGTSYTVAAGEPIATVHDLDQYVVVQATLATTDPLATPRVDDINVTFDGATTIDGRLFGDVDGNGSGAGDPGIDGVDVTLWLDNGDTTFDAGTDTNVATVASAGGGLFSFADQPPGTYFAVADESQLPAGFVTPGTTANPVGPITAVDCGTQSVEIGWQQQSAIVVTVFSDLDADGTNAGADQPIPSIDVELWSDDGDGVFDPGVDTRVATQAGDAAGVSVFPGLPIGSYFALVAAGDQPPGHVPTATGPNPIGPLTIVDDASVAAAIGFEPYGGITGTAFADLDGNGTGAGVEPAVAGVVVTIYRDDGDGAFDPGADSVTSSAVTAADGTHAATDLTSGDYWVVPGVPAAPNLPLGPQAVTVAAGDNTVQDLPFAQSASIGGIVVFDTDGVLDAASVPLPGTTLILTLDDGDGVSNAADTEVARATSDENGEFSFDGLNPGEYFVTLSATARVLPVGMTVIGDNPLGPVSVGTVDLVFAFDPTSIVLPETGATAARPGMLMGSSLVAFGLLLLLGTRRRIRWS